MTSLKICHQRLTTTLILIVVALRPSWVSFSSQLSTNSKQMAIKSGMLNITFNPRTQRKQPYTKTQSKKHDYNKQQAQPHSRIHSPQLAPSMTGTGLNCQRFVEHITVSASNPTSNANVQSWTQFVSCFRSIYTDTGILIQKYMSWHRNKFKLILPSITIIVSQW